MIRVKVSVFFLVVSTAIIGVSDDAVGTESEVSRYFSRNINKFEKAQKDKDFAKSKEILESLSSKKDKLSRYERAKLWEVHGTFYYPFGRDETIGYYEKALSERSGVVELECHLRLKLAQLYYLEKSYSESSSAFESLNVNGCEMKVEHIGQSAFALTGSGEFMAAKNALDTAYKSAEKKGIPAPDSWEVLLKDIEEALVKGYSKKFLPAPQYPPRALSRGVEGDVTVEFTMDVNGRVYDPVIVSSSSRLFDSFVLRFLQSDELKPFVKHWNIDQTQELERTFRFRIPKGRASVTTGQNE